MAVVVATTVPETTLSSAHSAQHPHIEIFAKNLLNESVKLSK